MIPEQQTVASNILKTADQLINGPRAASYGSALIGWGKVAKMWSQIIGFEISPKQCLLMMVCLKVVRETIKEDKDNIVDIAGYAGVIEKLIQELSTLNYGGATSQQGHKQS